MTSLGKLLVFPPYGSLPAPPSRIIWHWTAGGYLASPYERRHYHALIEWRDGQVSVVRGVPIRNNLRPLSRGDATYDPEAHPEGYAAHTRGFNSFSIGYAICGMRNAVSRDQLGSHPILPEQVDALVTLCAQTAAWSNYDLMPTEAEMFGHSEAERLHGVPQAGKWDIDWAPQVPDLPPEQVGHWLRAEIEKRVNP